LTIQAQLLLLVLRGIKQLESFALRP
jgi:hypothetical protein